MNRIADLISRGDPSSTAIVDGARRVSYAELDWLVDEALELLVGAGRPPGEGVAVQLGTGLAFVRWYLASSRGGFVTVPLNPGYTEPERDFVLDDSGARLLITAAGFTPLDATTGSPSL